MDTVFLVEDLFLQSIKRIKKGKCTRLDRIHRGYFASLSDAENAIKAQATYFMPKRLGFYVKEYQLNPKPETFNSQERQYSYSANGERICVYQYHYSFYTQDDSANAKWAEGDMVLFEACEHIWKGHVVQLPNNKDIGLEDIYQITTIEDSLSINLVKSACIFPLL